MPSSPNNYFPCFDCGAAAFLIRGSCAFCDPELHAEFKSIQQPYAVAREMFVQDTGLEPLQAWEVFEFWLESEWLRE